MNEAAKLANDVMNPVSFLTFVFLSPESWSSPVALAVSESLAGPLRVLGITLKWQREQDNYYSISRCTIFIIQPPYDICTAVLLLHAKKSHQVTEIAPLLMPKQIFESLKRGSGKYYKL